MGLVSGLAAALAGGWLFHRLGVPAGAMIGSMLAVALLKVADVAVPDLRGLIQFLIYVGVGWLLGQSFNPDLPGLVARNTVPILGTVGVLLVFSGGLAWVLWATGLMDPATAYLAAAPGGIAQMGIIGADVDADVSIVVTVHLLRVVSVIILAPIIVRLVVPSP